MIIGDDAPSINICGGDIILVKRIWRRKKSSVSDRLSYLIVCVRKYDICYRLHFKTVYGILA